MSLLFDGINDYLQTLTVPVSGYPFSHSFWFKPDDASVVDQQFMSNLGDATETERVYCYIVGSSETPQSAWGFYAHGATAGDGINIPSPAIADDTWQLWSYTAFSATDRRLYANGVNKLTTAVNIGTIASLDRYVVGMRPEGDGFYAGRISDAAFWSAALSGAQHAALLTLYPSEVAVANLTHYWPMRVNEDPAQDAVGSNDLDVVGATFDADNPTLALATRKARYKLQYRRVGGDTFIDVRP